MDKDKLSVFDSMPIGKAVAKNVLPSIGAMLMVLIYNLADTFFIGQTGDDLQVAAISFGLPLYMLFISIGTIFGIGGTSVISRALGRGEPEYAKHVSSFCFWSNVAAGVIFAVSIQLLMDPVLKAIGTTAQAWDYTKSYLSIVSFAGPFILLSSSFSNILRAEGQATKAMVGLTIGNMVNIILDPIFILAFGWGITGAAIATVIGNICGAMYFLHYLIRKSTFLSIKPKHYMAKNHIASSVLAIGIPASFGSMAMNISHIILNNRMAQYGALEVAASGVAMRINMIIGTLAVGLGLGIQPLLGFCVGARNWDRYRKILRFSIRVALVGGIFLTGVCYLFVKQIIGAFLTDPEAMQYGIEFARIAMTSAFMFGVFFCFINALQGMGAAGSALVVNASRSALIYLPAIFILEMFLGKYGLVWAQPVADLSALMIAIVLHTRALRKKQEAFPAPILENTEPQKA